MRHTAAVLALLAFPALALVPDDVEAQNVKSLQTAPVTSTATWSGRSTVYAPNGVAATSQPLATTAALEILRDGGNAIDAAVAAAAVLNVVEPYMTGMGGDMFAILWDAGEERLVGLDGSGKSGSKIDVEALAQAWDSVPTRGAPTVTVPGALAGWNALVETHGKLTLAEVLAPAIRIAEAGFPVTPIIARDWAGTVETLEGNAGAAATFLIDGKAPEAGQWFRNPDLARTFRRIAEDGPETFYGGDLGREIIAGLDELGGFLTLDDLANHEVRWVEPLSVDYKDYTLHELPPAGQGIAALQMLKMLEGVDFSGMVHNSSEYLHTLIEAKKLAYADLARYVADPEHMDVRPDALLDPAYLAQRAALIDPRRAMERAEPGPLATESDTVYLTVADREGNMISFINSVSWYFGSGVVVPGTGVILQNRGAGFVLEEGHPNRIGPNKRPFHTIIPAFVTRDGEPWLSYGVMSGSMQPQGHVQVLLNLVEFGMDPQEAVDAARFRHLNGKRVAVENLHPEVAASLAELGHELVVPTGIAFGGAQAILKLERGWAAGSDPRKDGMAAGH
ncbi:MAG: gamma-glutamyltransferase [Xanthomonadales bacterium]|jgi:gamma-glutamyltranspeptidase/glutathione hydrolase|nr:gamma-glutamyltransferase [Xanthomonadales bacterium]